MKEQLTKNELIKARKELNVAQKRKPPKPPHNRHSLESIAKLKARPAETNGGSFTGYYVTPAGRHASSYEAANAMGGVVIATTIRRWCQNAEKAITKQSFRKSAYLQTFGEGVIGMTPSELGFDFTPKA